MFSEAEVALSGKWLSNNDTIIEDIISGQAYSPGRRLLAYA